MIHSHHLDWPCWFEPKKCKRSLTIEKKFNGFVLFDRSVLRWNDSLRTAHAKLEFGWLLARVCRRVWVCGCVGVSVSVRPYARVRARRCVGVWKCGCMRCCWIVGDVILWFWFGSRRSAGTSYCPFLLSFVRVQRRAAVPCSAPRKIYLESVVRIVIVVDDVVVFLVSPLTAAREKQ